MDRGAWWATVHGIAKEIDRTEQLNNNNIQRHGVDFMALVEVFFTF